MTSLPLIPLQTDDRPAFLRTATGSRAHLPDCPHLRGTDAHAADDAEFLALPICKWSTAQIEGYGREHFDTIDDAIRRIGVPVQGHDEIVQGLKFVIHDESTLSTASPTPPSVTRVASLPASARPITGSAKGA